MTCCSESPAVSSVNYSLIETTGSISKITIFQLALKNYLHEEPIQWISDATSMCQIYFKTWQLWFFNNLKTETCRFDYIEYFSTWMNESSLERDGNTLWLDFRNISQSNRQSHNTYTWSYEQFLITIQLYLDDWHIFIRLKLLSIDDEYENKIDIQ